MKSQLFNTRRAVRFKQLLHKGYAAFCSMHREVSIGRLRGTLTNLELLKQGRAALLTVVLLGGNIVYAQQDFAPDESQQTTDTLSTNLFHLQEVQVLAHKAELESQSYRLVTTIRQADIAALPIQTVSDILQYLPGVDLRHRGATDAQVDVSIRGGTFDQVLVMLNGVPLSDAQTGHYSLNLPLSPLIIDRIEVLQGTAVRQSGAFSGAINIITRRTTDDNDKRFAIKTTAGMNALVRGEVTAVSALPEHWSIGASLDYGRSDGYYAPNPSANEQTALAANDYHATNIYLSATREHFDSLHAQSSFLMLQLAAQQKDAGAGLFYGSSLDQFDRTRTGLGSAQYVHRWGQWSVEALAAYRANYDLYEWHKSSPIGANTHLTQTANAAIMAHYASQIGTSTIGVELKNEHIESTNLKDTNRLNIHYFAEQTIHYHQLSASIGIAGDYNTFFGHNVTGGANIGYEYLPSSSVYINLQRALRLPTFTDLYYNAGNQLGNPNLKPEKAWIANIGATFNAIDGLSLTADAFYRLGTNIIDWVYVPEDTKRPYHAMNQQRIHSAGMELTAQYRARVGEYNMVPKISYAYTWLDLDLKLAQSRYLDYLSHKLVLGFEHDFVVFNNPVAGRLSASWTLRLQRREGQYTSAEGNVENYAPVCLLDGSVFWHNQTVKVAIDATNITNRHYYDYGALLMPGAWAKLSVTAQF